MPPKPPESLNLPLATALQRSEPLAGLLQRVRESRARYEAIAALLPAGLREGVRAGPLDETAWNLLVPHASAAAKLRQMLPSLEAVLRERGWAEPAIKIKIHPPA